MRWRGEIFVGLVLASCVEAGDPWGEVSIEVGLGFSPPASRLDEQQRLKTANDFRIVVDEVDVVATGVELLAQAGSAAGFDPSSPPPGYTLCHNGHCHADDGRLVSYEDIAAELAGGGGAEVAVTASGGALALPDGTGTVVIGSSCSDERPCEVLAPLTIGLVRVALGELRLSGRVFEGRTGAARVPAEGLPFEVVLESDPLSVGATASWRFGPGEPLQLALTARVLVPASVFDRVDWGEMDEAEVEVAVEGALVEGMGLELESRRFD